MCVTKEKGERQGEKEPNTRTKHKAIICGGANTVRTRGSGQEVSVQWTDETFTMRHVPVWVDTILQERGTTFPETSDWSFWSCCRRDLKTDTERRGSKGKRDNKAATTQHCTYCWFGGVDDVSLQRLLREFSFQSRFVWD